MTISELQKFLSIPVTGEFDEFTEAAYMNYRLKTGNSIDHAFKVGDTDKSTNEGELHSNLLDSDLSAKIGINIKRVNLDSDQRLNSSSPKKYIFLHATAGWDNPYDVVRDWNSDNRGAIGTQFVIGGKNTNLRRDEFDGEIIQTFDYNHYAWHLGIGDTPMHRNSIGIELCNLTRLDNNKGKYSMWAGKSVNASEVVDMKVNIRGYRYYHRITDAQLTSLSYLLEKISKDTNIDIRTGLRQRIIKLGKIKAFDYDVNIHAGKEYGVFTHTNVSPKNKWGTYSKWDLHPQDELCDMILSL